VTGGAFIRAEFMIVFSSKRRSDKASRQKSRNRAVKSRPNYQEHSSVSPSLDEALLVFHASNLLNGDVKPENIMRVEPDAQARKTSKSQGYQRGLGARHVVVDFGMVHLLDHTAAPLKGLLPNRPLYTSDYRAPEVLKHEPKKASDIWALGQTFLCLLFSADPAIVIANYKRKYYPPMPNCTEKKEGSGPPVDMNGLCGSTRGENAPTIPTSDAPIYTPELGCLSVIPFYYWTSKREEPEAIWWKERFENFFDVVAPEKRSEALTKVMHLLWGMLHENHKKRPSVEKLIEKVKDLSAWLEKVKNDPNDS